MSNSDSTTVWLIVVVLVGIVGLVVCAGLGAGMFWVMPMPAPAVAPPPVPSVVPIPNAQGSEADRQAFAREWRAPRTTLTNSADAEAAGLFPAHVDGWNHVSHDDLVQVPELALDRAGVHAVYGSGASSVDVYLCNVADEDEQAVIQAAVDAIVIGGGPQPTTRGGEYGLLDYARLTHGTPARHAWLWWSQGWLVVLVTTDGTIDLEQFQRAYLTRIQVPKPSPIEEL